MINKKIPNEIAFSIILILLIVFGWIFRFQYEKNMQIMSQAQTNVPMRTSIRSTQQNYPANVPMQNAQQGGVENSQTQQDDHGVAQSSQENTMNLLKHQDQDQQKPKSFKDDNVRWYDESKEVKDIELLVKSSEKISYKIWEIGTVTKGEYTGGRILLLAVVGDSPGGPMIYRFVQKKDDKQPYFMADYSATSLPDYYAIEKAKDGADVEIKFSKDFFSSGLKITSLEYPGTLVAPNGTRLKKEYDYSSETYVENKTRKATFDVGFNTKFLKLAFVDPIYGDVYTTDETKISGVDKVDIYLKNGFYLKAPDGTIKVYSEVVDLGYGFDAPAITWKDGTINDSMYTYTGESGCGAAAYADVASNVNSDDLTVIGKTGNGKILYGFKDKNQKLLKDYYNADLALANGEGENFHGKKFNASMSYDDFLNLHPIFLWKDSFGRWIVFISNEVVPDRGCGKPVIYLYPQQTENISVKVTPTAGMTVSIPEYNGGWNVISDPQSNIKNIADGKTYPYLFWEGSGKDIYDMPKQGFVVAKENLNSFFDEKLSQEGLIEKEINDFKEFWVPRMLLKNKPYYFVTFVDRSTIDRLAPLDITPKPDTTIRVLMDYEGLDESIRVQGFNIKTPERTGFTAVEWGGVLR